MQFASTRPQMASLGSGNVFGDRIFKVIGLAHGWTVIRIRADQEDVTDDVLHVAPASRTQLTITVGRRSKD